ncbi:MAG: acyl-CoA dehydrogenase family protein [Candidatus Binatia bacterium]|jgi:alkylation response protein AidB-like acyl-CoA dehydrogenase|nr:acyl-CoA dehydrogenase family protein [Candidatus Binatia bacterium]MDG2011741.1 acyl-CoA dehydrogenase family protein [Candidatus Binatia bacterium]
MDFKFTEEEESFRLEVREFLDANLPADAKKNDLAFIQEWDRKVRDKGWVGYTWPKEVGGGGGTIAKQVILKEEMSARRAPALGSCFMGLAWVGPGIIQYGTEEQKKRFIPDILNSEYQWCTGYSEPNVGSDLAALQCRGEREGDEYIVNGQKIWTSGAVWSKWMILLVRTDPDARVKHEGITCLLVPMDSPGVEVRPIQNMAGYSMFAEVFFNDVRVPVENRLGDEGEGWRVTISALANERSGIAEVTQMTRKLEELKALAKRSRRGGRPAPEDHQVRRRLARFEARIEAMRLNGLRYLTKQLKGEKLSSETSVNKLHRAELEVEMGDFALELLGAASGYFPRSEAAPDGGRWPFQALNWPEVVIGGGTPNIQKNIISERILGLPKD